MAGPLQHHTTALLLPSFQPRDLRKEPDTGYAARSRITTNPVSTTWGQGPEAYPRAANFSRMSFRFAIEFPYGSAGKTLLA